jgi:hypothetical protein
MELVATLAEKEKEILKCQDNLQNMKTHATDLQTFLGLNKIEQQIIYIIVLRFNLCTSNNFDVLLILLLLKVLITDGNLGH